MHQPIHPDVSLRRFADACSALLEAVNEEAILESLVTSACELSGSDCAYFAGRHGDELRVMAASGLRCPGVAENWRAAVGAGISGRVVASAAPATMTADADGERLADMDPILEAEGIRSAMVLPVRRRSQIVGALCVIHRAPVDPHQWPMEALTLLVRQAASDLDVAASLEQERLALVRAQTTMADAQRLKELIGSIACVLAMEKRMTPGLELLVGHLGGTVTVVGVDGVALDRAGSLQEAPLQAELELNDGNTRLAQLRLFRLLPLTPHERRTLEHCAGVLVLELLRARSALETERRLEGQLLYELLLAQITDDDSLRYRASLLGVDLEIPRGVVQLGIHVGGGRRERPKLHEIDLWTIEDCAREALRNPIGWISNSDVVLTFEVPGLTERDVRALLVKFVDEASVRLRKPLSAGMGRPCSTITDYPQAASEARMALEMARSRSAPLEVVVRDELGLYGLLGTSIDIRELISMTERVLAPLLDADEMAGSDYVHTLSVYHGCDRRLTEAAQVLHVHVNTLRYRLRKIEELLDVNLSDANVRFMLELALRAHKTLRPEQYPATSVLAQTSLPPFANSQRIRKTL